jgi:DNA-3-methyladenine glycosylase
MDNKKLKRKFFLQPTLNLAKEFLGKFLIHEINGQKVGGMIVETEAYIGYEDKASHAFGGKITPRNKAEYMQGGHIYIYLVYGMYWQLNISTFLEGKPECILIRGIEPTDGLNLMKKHRKNDSIKNLTNGPGKLCQALKFDKSLYGYDLCQKNAIVYFEDRGNKINRKNISYGPRIGIDYAGEYWSKIPWRFWIKNNPNVSKLS